LPKLPELSKSRIGYYTFITPEAREAVAYRFNGCQKRTAAEAEEILVEVDRLLREADRTTWIRALVGAAEDIVRQRRNIRALVEGILS